MKELTWLPKFRVAIEWREFHTGDVCIEASDAEEAKGCAKDNLDILRRKIQDRQSHDNTFDGYTDDCGEGIDIVDGQTEETDMEVDIVAQV
jgi:hypothetical protein